MGWETDVNRMGEGKTNKVRDKQLKNCIRAHLKPSTNF